MRSKILTSVIMMFCIVQNLVSCPVWRIGKMYIVDENNKPIGDAIVWRFYRSNDSIKMVKDHYGGYNDEKEDTNAYYFWSGGLRYSSSEQKTPKRYLLIQAKGYADVTFNNVQFMRNEDGSLATLTVKMYPKKLVKKGDLYTLMTNYIVEKKVEVKDSIVIDFDDYIEPIIEANAVVNAQRVATYAVRTFPNPVKDKLNIEIIAPVTKPYKAILMDVQGQLISESQLIAQNSVIDMEWQTAGLYFIQVCDPEGVLLYAFKFIKT